MSRHGEVHSDPPAESPRKITFREARISPRSANPAHRNQTWTSLLASPLCGLAHKGHPAQANLSFACHGDKVATVAPGATLDSPSHFFSGNMTYNRIGHKAFRVALPKILSAGPVMYPQRSGPPSGVAPPTEINEYQQAFFVDQPFDSYSRSHAHSLTNSQNEQLTNILSPPQVAAGPNSAPLPPSVEEAYRRKCIELKRRMSEVEENNDAFRLRKVRLNRGIRKMRLERAYLLETLSKRMRKNGSSVDGVSGFYDEESEGSSEGPPTVCI